MALAVDVTDRAALEPAFRRVEAELGPVDILVNNAGIANLSGGILQETAESWDAVIETQLNAVFLLSKLAAASMATRKRGKIINIGSMYSYFGAGLIPSYSTAKGAIVQLTKSMAIELAPHGIQVNAIAPGWIETDMTAVIRTEALKAMNDEILAAHASRPLGPARGNGWDGDLPGLVRRGLRDGRNDPRRRRLRHPLSVQRRTDAQNFSEGRNREPLETLAARTADPAPLRSRLAAARPDGRPGADHDAGAGRHRLRGGLGRAGNLRPVRHDRPAARLRAVRSEPHPGAGAGLLARRGDSRGRAAALGRRPDARRGAGEHDGGGVGAGVHPGRRAAPGIRHRAAVQADPLRLHERHRAHRADQPAAQAVRLLDRRRRAAARPRADRRGGARRPGQLDRVRGRRRHARGDPAAQALQAHPGPPDRGRRRDRRGRRARPRPERRA